MFENMNPLDRSTAWLEIFLLMFGAFIIGYFFARWYYKQKGEKKLEACLAEIRTLKILGGPKDNPSLKAEEAGFETIDQPGMIKAIKTRERAGVPVEARQEMEQDTAEKQSDTVPKNRSAPVNMPTLNFDSFGKAKKSERDDLKKINGIGPSIEKKLNSIGIYTFQQISRFSKEDIETVTTLIQFFPGRIERDNWKGQAKSLKA